MSPEDQIRVGEAVTLIAKNMTFLAEQIQRIEAELGKISGDTQAILGRIAEMDEDKQ